MLELPVWPSVPFAALLGFSIKPLWAFLVVRVCFLDSSRAVIKIHKSEGEWFAISSALSSESSCHLRIRTLHLNVEPLLAYFTQVPVCR
jgi:hypothetical protein